MRSTYYWDCAGANTDPYYSQLLVDKMLFMLPSDQARLRDCMTRQSLLDELLALREGHAATDWFQKNARAYLEICDLFGRSAAADGLVKAVHRGARCRSQRSTTWRECGKWSTASGAAEITRVCAIYGPPRTAAI